MNTDFNRALVTNMNDPTQLINPIDAINTMVDLRVQIAELEQQIKAKKPAFGRCLCLPSDR